MKRLTIAAAKKAIPEGISLRKVDSEYRVTFDGAETIKRYGLGANPESFAYYTDDLHDAVETAQAMIKHHRVSSHVSAHVAHERKETAAYEHSEHTVKRGPGRPRKVAPEPKPIAKKREETPEQVRARMEKVRSARKSGK